MRCHQSGHWINVLLNDADEPKSIKISIKKVLINNEERNMECDVK